MVGHKTGRIYYVSSKIENGATNRFVCTIDPNTKAVREIMKLTRGWEVSAVNADETLLAGTITEQDDSVTNDFPNGGPNRRNDIATAGGSRSRRGRMMEDRFARHYPMELFFYNLRTGETKTFNRCTDWLNHLQFSPTDPTLLMFCHEGPWHKVDRIWTIRADGTDLKLIHQRTMAMEIAGHEFWSADGQTIWYDLQTPRGEDFWVAGYHVHTGARTWYHLQRNEWSVHFNVSPDGKLFSGDGGDKDMVAHADNGKWIYLFRPELIVDRSAGSMDTSRLIRPGVFHSERLVNMAKHDYALEPNAMFSPDMKWLIFRSQHERRGPGLCRRIEEGGQKIIQRQPFSFRSKISPASAGFALPLLNVITRPSRKFNAANPRSAPWFAADYASCGSARSVLRDRRCECRQEAVERTT